jgi:SHS2 domain-containing protein
MQSLMFAFLDELLFIFSTEMFVVRELRLGPINRDSWELHVTACVLPRLPTRSSLTQPLPTQCRQPVHARTARARHRGATVWALGSLSARAEPAAQVKAITYSAMQIHDREGDAETFVIVDI